MGVRRRRAKGKNFLDRSFPLLRFDFLNIVFLHYHLMVHIYLDSIPLSSDGLTSLFLDFVGFIALKVSL